MPPSDGGLLPSDLGVSNPMDAVLPPLRVSETLSDRCLVPLPYDDQRPIFTEKTQEWGLIEMGVKGTRLSVGDINGDGLPDLSVRRAGTRFDRLTDDETTRRQFHWLLQNNGSRFSEITQSSKFSGVRCEYPEPVGRPAEIVVFADVDNDGDLDAYAAWTPDNHSPLKAKQGQ